MKMGNICVPSNNLPDVIINNVLKNKQIIWNASLKHECISIELRDGSIYVGRPIFCDDDDYSKLPKGTDMIFIHLKLINDVPRDYHIGGDTKFIVLWDLLNIIVMDEAECEDAKNYSNNAPLFLNRLFEDEINEKYYN